MRKTTIYFLMLMCSMLAFGQEPQWTVVGHVFLTQQNSFIPSTNLVTPTEPGAYRITVYFSGGDKIGAGFFELFVSGLDITGKFLGINTMVVNCNTEAFNSMPPLTTILRPGTPLSFEVVPVKVGAADCQYNLAITVEQLVQQ